MMEQKIQQELILALRAKSEADANRYNLRCLYILSCFSVLSEILNIFGLYQIQQTIMLVSMIIMVFLFMLPGVVRLLLRRRVDPVEQPWFKLLIIGCSTLGVAVICVTLSMHAVLLMAIPPLMAAQYRMSKKLFVWTLAVAVLLVPIGIYGCFFFGAPDRNLLKGIGSGIVDFSARLELGTPQRLTELLTHHALPRIFAMLAIVLLTYSINYRLGRLLDRQAELSRQVREEMERLNDMQSRVIDSLATLIENRDADTGEHVFRTKLYVHLIGEELRKDPAFRGSLTEEDLQRFERAAPLHDVGKIAVSDAILLKPGRLTPEEFDKMKCHTTKGEGMVKSILSDLDEKDFLETAQEIALSHHERWDGKGYPQGLKGEEIPLCARIMAVADVFDALVSVRVYKSPVSPEKALDMMMEESGTHFDPEIMRIVWGMRDTLIAAAKAPIAA